MLETVKIDEKLDTEDKSSYGESAYSDVIVLKEYHNDPRKLAVNDFVEYFRLRYNLLKDLLQNRQELQGAISINRILAKKGLPWKNERESKTLLMLVLLIPSGSSPKEKVIILGGATLQIHGPGMWAGG